MRERSLNRAERLRALEQLLCQNPNGIGANELAERCGVHRATIYRDITSLDKMDVPVWQEKGLFGIERTRYVTQIRLTLYEAMALYLATRLLAHHSDECNPHVASALEKLAEATPPPITEHIRQAAGMVRHRGAGASYVAILETLTQAWAEQRSVRIRYRAANTDEAQERLFDIYFLEPSGIGYACYTIGHDHLSGEQRTFKLERIEHIELLSERYEIPADFDPYPYLEKSWGIMGGKEDQEIVVRFSPAVARRVRESIWHPSQIIEDVADGGCQMTVRIAHPLEMKWWIRGWGADAEVLSPAWLRTEISQEAQATAGLYEIAEADTSYLNTRENH